MRQLFGFWNIFEKRAARRLIDTLRQVHIKLAAGDPWPPWMSDLLAQYRFIWDKDDFKKTSEKIKKKKEKEI